MPSPTTSFLQRPALWQVVFPATLGASGLFFAAQSPPASTGFYAGTFFTAAVWLVTWWRYGNRDAYREGLSGVTRGVLVGSLLIVFFMAGAMAVRMIPVLAGPVSDLLDNMRTGTVLLTLITLVVNGVGEEMFFRDVVQRHLDNVLPGQSSVIVQVGIYLLVTMAMGVPLLIVAALLVGGIATFEARRAGNLVSATALHLTWGVGMAFLLPPLIH